MSQVGICRRDAHASSLLQAIVLSSDLTSQGLTYLEIIQGLEAQVQNARALHLGKVAEQELARVVKGLCQWLEVQSLVLFVLSHNTTLDIVPIACGVLFQLKGVGLHLCKGNAVVKRHTSAGTGPDLLTSTQAVQQGVRMRRSLGYALQYTLQMMKHS